MATTTLEAFKKELNPAVVEKAEKQASEPLKKIPIAPPYANTKTSVRSTCKRL